MNNKHLFEELIDDLCVLSEDGLPNLKSSESLSYISEFFNRKGLGELGMTLIQNLTEGDQFSNPALNKVIKYKTVNGEDAEGKVGNLLRRPKEEDAHKKALDSLGGEGSDTYKKAMDDLGGENQPDRNIDKEKEKKEDPAAGGAAAEQEPPKPSAFVGKAGDDYRANLPKNDPAYVAPKDEAGDGMDIETQVSTNKENLNGFIKNGYTKSKGAPGSPGSMLNEIVSISSATDTLNQGGKFDYQSQLKKNVEMMKDSELAGENDSDKASGKKTSTEAKELAKQEGISIGLASKIIIATKAAENKHNRVQQNIIDKNNLQNYEAVPLFGDSKGLQTQRDLIKNAKGKIKLGNTEIDKDEAIAIINAGGGGNNPSDTAIFTVDKDTGDVYMAFFSDKDATSAIVAQSSLKAENELKKAEISKMVEDGLMDETEAAAVKDVMDSKIAEYDKLQDDLSEIVNGPGEHLKNVSPTKMVGIAKNLSKGANADKYWKKQVVSKFENPNKKLGDKRATEYLPQGHQTPPTDEEMMQAYVTYVNDPANQGNLTKDDQRVVLELSNNTDGPKLGAAIGEIRKRTVQTDLKLINELNNHTITLENGNRVPLGNYLEAKSVAEKLHLDMLFGGEGVYQDETAFCQESGGVTVDKKAMANCLPYDNKDDVFSHFEIGEEKETTQRGTMVITGGSRIVYAITKDGQKYAMGEKTQRSKTGALGKLETVYKYHPDLQKCFDSQ
jgi:hypothetical protein